MTASHAVSAPKIYALKQLEWEDQFQSPSTNYGFSTKQSNYHRSLLGFLDQLYLFDILV